MPDSCHLKAMSNPLLETWSAPFESPPFDRIRPEHFKPAYEHALDRHRSEIAAIASSKEAPSFENTIVAVEDSGRMLARTELVFSQLAGAHTNDALQEIERDMAPVLARHWNEIYLNAALFQRIDALFKRRATLGLDAESLRVLERYHLDFVRAGAKLTGAERDQLAEVTEKLAILGTEFAQNVLADEQSYVLPLGEDDVAGLPGFARDAAAEAAKERSVAEPYALTTGRSSVEPFLQFAERRELREKILKAWISRGASRSAYNNESNMREQLRLRVERARLLGYPTFAHFKLADTMAKTPEAARALLEQVWTRARARALEERDALQALIAEEGGNFSLAAWDWRFYAEKLRKRRYDLDESEIKPFLQLPKMIEAAFFTANRLFGVTFEERSDVPTYHPDVRVWEVKRDRKHVGLFLGDYFARSSKRSGAWMTSFREQENLSRAVAPIVVNTCNFVKGDPALLSFDEARTLFHEFGHGLHGLLSNVRFPRLSGTNVARDFVELPSQIFEHWLEEPEILGRFAVHFETGEPMPHTLLEKLIAARNFNQGFATVEFLASAFVDMDFHALERAGDVDPSKLEASTLSAIAMPDEIVPRHAAPHFLHIFAGDGYSAGYYSYLWAEVLDADGFAAFKEKNDAFDKETAQRLYDNIYSVGGTRDFAETYRAFRSRDPKVEALLEGRGLAS
jgi:peptidyl-dipeptidase Dcp